MTLYEFMRQPPFYVVRDADGYWLVPVQPDGWREREPFVGRVGDLRPLAATPPCDLGLPGGGPLGRGTMSG